MSVRLLLDCDPGIDDTFAIFCALRYAELAAVTTVSGNVPIDHTTRNARYALELAGADHVPVHRGAAAPLEVEPAFSASIHGAAGLGDFVPPEPNNPTHPMPAVDAMGAFLATGGSVIVATGPLTNVASLLLADPRSADSIERLYWMGGSTDVGNRTPHAEFNSWADPHAVDVVFRSSVPVTMFGLNLTHQVRMSEPHVERLEAGGTETGRHAARALGFYERHGANDGRGQPMHDPCAVLGVTHPDLFTVEHSFSVVATTGSNRGRTSITTMDDTNSAPIDVAVSADSESVIDHVIAAAIDPVVER